MRQITFALLGLIFVSLLHSCKKDKSPLELLTDGTWTFAQSRISINGSPTAVISLSCYLDDTVEFTKDGQAILDYGTALCDTLQPESETSVYVLSEDGMRLGIDRPSGFSQIYQVKELTESRLVYFTESLFGIDSSFQELTYVR